MLGGFELEASCWNWFYEVAQESSRSAFVANKIRGLAISSKGAHWGVESRLFEALNERLKEDSKERWKGSCQECFHLTTERVDWERWL